MICGGAPGASVREWREVVDVLRRRGPLRVDHKALRVVGECSGHTRGVQACAWAPDGSALLTASWDSTARVWSAGDWCKESHNR